MGTPLSVFVSHSAKDGELTRAVCDELRKGGPGVQGGYQILVDFDDLHTGVEWPPYLHEWMGRCNAAVVLLTESAAKSAWVLKELTILTWRRSMDPAFKLFLVVFPEAEALLQQNLFSPLFLSMIQRVKATTPDGIGAEVRAVLGAPVLAPTLFDQVVGQYCDVLRNVGDCTLKTLASRLDATVDASLLALDEHARTVETVSRLLARGELGKLGVNELIDLLNFCPAKVASDVLRLVSSYWIDPEAACQLLFLMDLVPRTAAVLNGAFVCAFTAQQYVRRAHPLSLRYQMIEIGGGAHDKIVDHVTSEVCAFQRRGPPYTSATTNETIVGDLRAGKPRWYAVVPPPLPDRGALAELLDRFPTIVFIFSAGEGANGDASLDRVRRLSPAVDIERESLEWDRYREAEDVIRQMSA